MITAAATSPYEGLQDFIAGLPDFVQPLLVALVAAVPYIEGEGSTALGILAGIHPLTAALAGIAGNLLSVVVVVLLGARIRGSVRARRAERATAFVGAGASSGPAVEHDDIADDRPADAGNAPTRREKGRRRLGRWLVRFGVPGASLLAPLALPTQLTAAFFVASGVSKGWVIVWQAIAIVLWTGLVAAAALGLVSALGW